jgi:PAS domain-containing protein
MAPNSVSDPQPRGLPATSQTTGTGEMGNALLLGSPTQILDAQQLIAAFENSPEGLAIADHGRIVYANAAFAELFAYSDRAEMSGKALSSLRPRSYQCERTSLGSSPASESGGRVCEFLGVERTAPKFRSSRAARLSGRRGEICWLLRCAT